MIFKSCVFKHLLMTLGFGPHSLKKPKQAELVAQGALSCSSHGSHSQPEAALTFSTSVGLASAEEMTPETTPQITLMSNVSSATKQRRSDPHRRGHSRLGRAAQFSNQTVKLQEQGLGRYHSP